MPYLWQRLSLRKVWGRFQSTDLQLDHAAPGQPGGDLRCERCAAVAAQASSIMSAREARRSRNGLACRLAMAADDAHRLAR